MNICKNSQEKGVKFSDFMQDWLYGREGYYSSYKDIGKEGDFFTAVSASSFFGGSIANRLIKIIKDKYLHKDTTILEIGAHKGYLLADIAQFIYTIDEDLFDSLNFAILEPRVELHTVQRDYFKNSFGNRIELKIFSNFEDMSLPSAFVVANEIFDAFACEVIKDDKMLYMKKFDSYFDKQDKYTETISKRYTIKKGEIAKGYEEFALNLYKSIGKFEFVTFDYGDKLVRNDFSLRIYDKHKVYPFFSLTHFVEDKNLTKEKNLQSLYKISDITYDVNFSHLIDSFLEANIKTLSYMTQLKALVEFGLLDLLEIVKNRGGQKSYLKELNKVKYLIDPSFMGERFKCVIFRKD